MRFRSYIESVVEREIWKELLIIIIIMNHAHLSQQIRTFCACHHSWAIETTACFCKTISEAIQLKHTTGKS